MKFKFQTDLFDPPIGTYQVLPLRTRVDLEVMAMGTLNSPKLRHYWSLIIRLFIVISRTHVWEVLPLCRDSVGIFYSSSRLVHFTRLVACPRLKYILTNFLPTEKVGKKLKSKKQTDLYLSQRNKLEEKGRESYIGIELGTPIPFHTTITHLFSFGVARGVMVIVVGIGHDDTSSNPGLIALHIALIPLGKVWIQLFSLHLWVNSWAD